jgi:hypothetical protein
LTRAHPSWARRIALALALWAAAVGGALAQAAPAVTPAGEPAQRQQVLVLLRLPPEHFGAGSGFSGGYGGGGAHAARQRIAARLARAHGLTLVEGWPMPLVGVDCFIMDVPTGRSVRDVALDLSHEREVEWSEPVQTYRALGAAQGVAAQGSPARGPEARPPNDPLYRLQPAGAAWRLAELHQVATGRHVRVAIVDSRVDERHPDLAGQVETRQDFVADRPGGPEQHGTGVAGIIAAVADNGIGIAGVAPGARLMALRACWQEPGAQATVCDTLSLAKALHFAVDHGAQVINLSLSGPPDVLLGKLLDVAQARGAIVVGAIDPHLPGGGFPASHAGVVAVTDDPAQRNVPGAVLAPGRDVPTTAPGGGWSLVNGSSFAAAHVSGLFALIREKNPNARSPLTLVASRASGVIDVCASVLRAAGPCRDCACPRTAALASTAAR